MLPARSAGQPQTENKGLWRWDAKREKVLGSLAGLFLHEPDVSKLQRVVVALKPDWARPALRTASASGAFAVDLNVIVDDDSV